MPHSVSSDQKPQPSAPIQQPQDPLWSQALSEPETLSGFCLEWIQDRADSNKGRPS